MAKATIIIPAEFAGVLRHIALADHRGFQESMGEYEGDALREHREMAAHPKRLLDALGWEAPVTTDCEVRGVDARFLAGLMTNVVEDALAPLETGMGSRLERNQAIARLRCAAAVFEALEGER